MVCSHTESPTLGGGGRWGGGRGLKLRLHPLCACVVAAAVESLDYTLADKVLNHGLAALK